MFRRIEHIQQGSKESMSMRVKVQEHVGQHRQDQFGCGRRWPRNVSNEVTMVTSTSWPTALTMGISLA